MPLGYPGQDGAYPPKPQQQYPQQTNMAYPPQTAPPPAPMGYPPQQQHASYPPASGSGYPPQQGYPPSHGYPPTGPPPPYSTAAPPMQHYPQASYPMAPQAAPQAAPYYPMAPRAAYPAGVVSGHFDESARFGAGATYNIPPAPPGVAPNSAQMGQMRGHNVVMNQQKSGWFSGPRDGGGSTFW